MQDDLSFSDQVEALLQARPVIGLPPSTADRERQGTGAAVAHVRIGLTVFDAPDRALEAICALTAAGLGVEQVGLVALGPVMSECAKRSSNWLKVAKVDGLFQQPQTLCVLSDGKPLIATSASLFEPIEAAIGPQSGSTTVRAREQRKELEKLLQAGAIALVAKAADARQQEKITRLLLANSQHRVTTYDVPRPAPAA